MLTVICETPGVLRAIEGAAPTRAEDEVLLRIRRVGVCGTDLHIFTGNQPYLAYPRVMGHEISGTVEAAPASSPLQPGDTVFVMPYLSCGQCVACRQGKTNCCVNIQVLGVHRDGAFTENLSVPAQFVRKAEGVTLDQAAMVEFLAIGAHAVRRADVQPGQRVLVLGTGEFMHASYMLGAGLEALGLDVVVQSTTRSPILKWGSVSAALAFPDNYGEGVTNFLYNVTPGMYDHVFICHETAPNDALRGLAEVFHARLFHFITETHVEEVS